MYLGRLDRADLTDAENTCTVGGAMTTAAALTRVPSSQITGLVGALAFILLVVISIIPH